MTVICPSAGGISWPHCAGARFPISSAAARAGRDSKGMPVLTTRRDMLIGASAFGLAAGVPLSAKAAGGDAAPGDAAAARYLQAVADELLSDFPENALSLG